MKPEPVLPHKAWFSVAAAVRMAKPIRMVTHMLSPQTACRALGVVAIGCEYSTHDISKVPRLARAAWCVCNNGGGGAGGSENHDHLHVTHLEIAGSCA